MKETPIVHRPAASDVLTRLAALVDARLEARLWAVECLGTVELWPPPAPEPPRGERPRYAVRVYEGG